MTVNQVATVLGTPSYTSGAQVWIGAEASLITKAIPVTATILSGVELDVWYTLGVYSRGGPEGIGWSRGRPEGC